MKLFTFVLVCGFQFSIHAQNIPVENAIPNPVSSIDWFTDLTVYDFHPVGRMSGVQKSDGTLFVAVNDTLATSNLGIVVFTSTNSGTTWTLYPTGVSFRRQFQNLKMVKSPQDSIYVFFNNYSVISCWNVLTGSYNEFTNYPAGYRDFDVACSSTGSLYLLLDLLANNEIRIFGSANGGFTWPGSLFLSSTGAGVRGSMSATGDTLLINYYGVLIQPDTSTSAIRSVRYRESAPGTIAIAGSFSTPIASAGTQRKQMMAASGNGEVWLVYTLGPDGARAIYGMKSIDKGTTYGAPQLISLSPATDNYYFDIRYISNIGNGNSGFALIYYSDSLQTGSPTNNSDKLMFCTAPYGGSFNSPIQISDVPPVFSDRMYIPKLVPMPFSNNDLGALWVGEDASVRKLCWDRLLATVPVELTSFTAEVHGKIVNLLWTTSTEINNKGFAIEKNTSGTWQQIGFVNGIGSSTLLHNYYYSDDISDVNATSVKYRLKQIDFDGTFEYSPVVEVSLSVPSSYSLEQNYPNPFNPITKIRYSISSNVKNQISKVVLKVYDLIGNEVAVLVNEEQQAGHYEVEFSAQGGSAFGVDGSNISSGVYFYKLQAGEFIQTKKMILLR